MMLPKKLINFLFHPLSRRYSVCKKNLLRLRQEVVLFISQCLYFKKDNKLIIFPNAPRASSGSNLFWGWELAKELKRLGWSVIVIPSHFTYQQRRRLIRFYNPNALLMIKGRHPLNYPKLYKDVPSIFILDDADYILPTQVDQVIECCKTSSAIIAGNELVANWCKQYNDQVSVIWVSHPIPKKRPSVSNSLRSPIVAWAHAFPKNYPVEANFIQEVLLQLAERQTFEFWLYGVRSPEQGEKYVEPLRKKGIFTRTFNFMSSYKEYLKTLEEVAVGLHPVCLENPYSQGKSFGKILSYICADVAVVTHEVLDHRYFFHHAQNGMLANTVEEYVDSIEELLVNPAFRQKIVDTCNRDFINQLSTPIAARKINNLLTNVISK